MRRIVLRKYIEDIKTGILEDPTISIDEEEKRLASMPRFTDKVPKWVLAHIKRGRVRKKGRRVLKFDVDIKYLQEIFDFQEGRCALTGNPLWFVGRSTNQEYQNASLDRIDSKFGYIKENVQWVAKEVNQMKFDMEQERFVELCVLIARNHLLDEEIKSFESAAEKEAKSFREKEKEEILPIVKAFLSFVKNNYTELNLIGIDIEKRLVFFHFPTYFKKWETDIPKKNVLAAIKERDFFVTEGTRRLKKAPTEKAKAMRILILKVDGDVPDYLKSLYEELQSHCHRY